MEKRRELVENLIPARQFTPEEVATLARDIDKHGLKKPLLVNGTTRVIIDGSKRHAALVSLGFDSVEAEFSRDMLEVVEVIHEESLKEPPTVARIGAYIDSFDGIVGRGPMRHRTNERWRAVHPELPEIRQANRQMMAYAFNGAVSDSSILRLQTLRSRVRALDPVAMELAVRVESGELTPHQADTIYSAGVRKFNGALTRPAEQGALIDNTARNLAATVAALRNLRSPVKAPELPRQIAALKRVRTELISLIRALEKELGK